MTRDHFTATWAAPGEGEAGEAEENSNKLNSTMTGKIRFHNAKGRDVFEAGDILEF
ncbi:hypothetical protein [Leadbettera azotonutricia]|uniref:Uncharacterized protein n=1 Tax=Leadbettera azotonutricia (strain ATCC BAA-888 / DSM 13862 / ZAS-9) TaxID=545695 RepID=F5Y7R8_LEAAZ|nr:hypothetical protein [Leadbettera azotonutricia]AEF81122.1 hypothetical protein TREAZ_3451 [Leadbettera azotonutricia ZAS-9]